jgi:hypothetical protein
VLAVQGRSPGSFFAGGVLWTGIAISAAALLGIGVALWVGAPRDPLHLIYGALSVGAVPGAALVANGQTGRRRAAVWAIAGVVLVILVLRLFQTGG